MPESLIALLDQLDHIAAYAGPWRPLRDEAPRLRTRVRELCERESRLDELLVIALVGGSGVGKSTLLNALAGDQLAATSEFRPCTAVPTVYHPPGATVSFEGWTCVSGSALEHLVIIDTPDSDTIVREHRTLVIEALRQCDLILICGSTEKYLDEATWSLLRPLQRERAMVCVETKASEQAESIREHWLARMAEQDFEIAHYFRVSARRALDRKLTGQSAGSEFDFPALENFLREELTRERIQRIKRSNAIGLLSKTITSLQEHIVAREPNLIELQGILQKAEFETIGEAARLIRENLFAEPHLWNFALGREITLRAKGLVGTLFRLFEGLRLLPTRIAGWLPGLAKGGRAGRHAAALLADAADLHDGLWLTPNALQPRYLGKHSELSLEFARAGFDPPQRDASLAAFTTALEQRMTEFLRGPVRQRIVTRARALTGWPATLLADAAPVAFLGFTCYRIVCDYFSVQALTGTFFLYSVTVLAIILGVELAVLSILARLAAWTARRRSMSGVFPALSGQAIAFHPEEQTLGDTLAIVKEIGELCVAFQRDCQGR